MANKNSNEVTGWVGWIGFASLMLLISGAFHMLQGFISLFQNNVFVVGPEALWVFDYNTWGWIHILGGLLAVLAAGSLARGHLYGKIYAVLAALVSAFASMAFVPVAPVWSSLVLVIDVLVIWAVTVHGNEVKKLS